MVKITGDLMLSFPAGIIQALTGNPSPPVLSFKIKNSDRLEQVLPNKQLITKLVIQTHVRKTSPNISPIKND